MTWSATASIALVLFTCLVHTAKKAKLDVVGKIEADLFEMDASNVALTASCIDSKTGRIKIVADSVTVTGGNISAPKNVISIHANFLDMTDTAGRNIITAGNYVDLEISEKIVHCGGIVSESGYINITGGCTFNSLKEKYGYLKAASGVTLNCEKVYVQYIRAASDQVTFSGNELIVNSSRCIAEETGIYAYNNISLKGVTISVNGFEDVIHSENGSVDISASVQMKLDFISFTYGSDCISAYKDITITGGRIEIDATTVQTSVDDTPSADSVFSINGTVRIKNVS